MTDVSHVKQPLDESHWTSRVISQPWFRQLPGAVRQQAFSWTDVDPELCRHKVSIDHKDFTLPYLDAINTAPLK